MYPEKGRVKKGRGKKAREDVREGEERGRGKEEKGLLLLPKTTETSRVTLEGTNLLLGKVQAQTGGYLPCPQDPEPAQFSQT